MVTSQMFIIDPRSPVYVLVITSGVSCGFGGGGGMSQSEPSVNRQVKHKQKIFIDHPI